MRAAGRLPVPDPDERPEAYQDLDQLKSLYIERGWTREQIAEYFDTTVSDIRATIEKHDISKGEGTHPPNRGLAAQLWEHGRQEAIE